MPASAEIVARRVDAPPHWALLQRNLLDSMSEAALAFVERYTRPDGALIWRDEWPGMDGSDDGYESFHNFALLYALGGRDELAPLAERLWDAVTWQFTQYGQIEREFDAYYDWMHHGESSVYLYYLALADPGALKFRQRAAQFAAMYTGDDPAAPNYDPERRLIRSPITGSRGPRFEMTAEDWCTHRAVLDHYPPPFEDIPGVSGPTAQWTDDRLFAEILSRMNARMAKGDVPLNLTASSLIAHAFMFSGEERLRRWVTGYTASWAERTAANGGILPDNVGPGGAIGECMDGNWWGGYYGWRWPHGAWVMFDAVAIGCMNAALLSGDLSALDLIRSQIDLLWGLRREAGGQWRTPNKHLDAGWSDWREPDARLPILLWSFSQAAEDLERVLRLPNPTRRLQLRDTVGKGDQAHTEPWFEFVQGRLSDYPVRILSLDARHTRARQAQIRADHSDPREWDVHHWQDLNPVLCEGLVQTTLGSPMAIYHGGLLHARLRYFDDERRRPGLPPGVAALVEEISVAGVIVQWVNTDPLHERRLIVQAGAFGEHAITGVAADGEPLREVEPPYLRVVLPPGTALRAELRIRRFCRTPSYARPWQLEGDEPLLRGRG